LPRRAEEIKGKRSFVKASVNNRILMLLENLPYPQDVRVRREATALAAAGYRVSVICPAAPGQPSRETVNGVRVYRYAPPRTASGFLGYLWEYGYSMAASFTISLSIFFGEGFDAVHAHNPPETFVFIAMFYKLFGKRFVFDHHDLSPEMYQARFPGTGNRIVHAVLVWLEKITCCFADHIIATNESYKKVEMDRDHVPESHISVVRNGIELNRLHPVEPDPVLRWKAKTIIGYVGVMGFQDGVDYLLRALHHLVHDLGRTDFYCALIGGGDAWPNLKKLVSELALDEYVWLPGFVFGEELRRYLSAADICVVPDPSNPYNDRSTMVKIMEYMALGKPIVAFDLPEHRFSARQAAVYVRGNDEVAFARAVAELMDDPLRRERLGAFGKQRIKNELAWDFSVPKLLAVYRKVLPPLTYSQELLPQAERTRVRPQHAPITPGPVQIGKQGDA
jgi:glycosyltransferase involved in cell wall biosynthesis